MARGRFLGALVLVISLAGLSRSADPPSRKILLLSQGPDGHPTETHEYAAGQALLRKLLKRVDGIDAKVVRADEPWKEGPKEIDEADAVVLYLSEGARWLQQDEPRLAAFQRLAKRGGGIVALHWGMGTRDAKYIDEFVALLGACHGGPDRKYVVAELRTEIAAPEHPVMTAVEPVLVRDEFYYRLKVSSNEPSLTPLLRVTIEGKPEMVAWCREVESGSRSFGFTGLHFHSNWQHEAYRRMVVQGILWTARAPLPKGGCDVDINPSDLKLPQKAVPEEVKNWKIRFEGMGGHGADTHFFRAAVSHDGTMKVEKRSEKRGPFRKVFDGRLEEDEAAEMLRVAARVVNDFRREKSEGEWEDGWEITIGVSGDSLMEQSVTFSKQSARERKDEPLPAFLQLAKLINKHLKRDPIP